MTAIPEAFVPVTVDVIVTNATGPSVPSAGDVFTYQQAAGVSTVASVSPNHGSTAGGTALTVVGTGFTGATDVRIGGTSCTSLVVVDDSHITCVSPLHVAGTFHTRVTTPAGVSAGTSADTFTFADPGPTVTAIAPATGPTAGGTTVVITGTGFTPATRVLFGTTDAASFHVDSSTQITAISPAGAGTVDVFVLIGTVSSPASSADQFTFAAPALPTVTGVAPNNGAPAGGTSVVIDGSGLGSVTAVRFGTTPAASFSLNTPSAGRITAVSPAGAAGTIHVEVDNPAGTSPHSVANKFTYNGTGTGPTITSVTPDHGPQAGGTTVVIAGVGFTGATAVAFDPGHPAAGFSVDSDTQITCVAPAHPGALTVDVIVTTPAGASAIVAADAYTYPGPPTVTNVSPSHGTPDGGTAVTITGTNFE